MFIGPRRALVGGAAFTPAALYVGGESGDYWDPADLTKLFQLSTGSTAVTTADDPVGYMGGQRGVHNLIQATDANRPLYKSSGVTSNLAFDDSNDILAVAASQSLFKYLHDGTGGSCWSIFKTAGGEDKRGVGDRGGTSTAAIGIILSRQDATSRPTVIISNGTAHVANLVPGSGTPWPANTLAMVLATYSTADGIRLYLNGVELANAAEAAAPSTSNSNATFQIPSIATGGPEDMRACGAISRVLTPTEVLNLYNYYHNRGSL